MTDKSHAESGESEGVTDAQRCRNLTQQRDTLQLRCEQYRSRILELRHDLACSEEEVSAVRRHNAELCEEIERLKADRPDPRALAERIWDEVGPMLAIRPTLSELIDATERILRGES